MCMRNTEPAEGWEKGKKNLAGYTALVKITGAILAHSFAVFAVTVILQGMKLSA